MDAKSTRLNEKLESLLSQAAAVASELQSIEQGDETPHYDQVELPAHDLGQRFSRMIQTERALEIALVEKAQAACPECSQQCDVEIQQRTINSMDGPLEVSEPVAKCCRCRQLFFPSACRNGI